MKIWSIIVWFVGGFCLICILLCIIINFLVWRVKNCGKSCYGLISKADAIVNIREDGTYLQELMEKIPTPKSDDNIQCWGVFVDRSEDVHGEDTTTTKFLNYNNHHYEKEKLKKYIGFLRTIQVSNMLYNKIFNVLTSFCVSQTHTSNFFLLLLIMIVYKTSCSWILSTEQRIIISKKLNVVMIVYVFCFWIMNFDAGFKDLELFYQPNAFQKMFKHIFKCLNDT